MKFDEETLLKAARGDARRLSIFREWAAEDPPDPVKVAHIAHLARLTAGPAAPPGLLEKAMNLGKAVVEHVAAGMPTLDDEAAGARLAICRACDRYEDGTCQVCGCFMPVKARWAEQQCPLEKWPEGGDIRARS